VWCGGVWVWVGGCVWGVGWVCGGVGVCVDGSVCVWVCVGVGVCVCVARNLMIFASIYCHFNEMRDSEEWRIKRDRLI